MPFISMLNSISKWGIWNDNFLDLNIPETAWYTEYVCIYSEVVYYSCQFSEYPTFMHE